MPYGPRLRAPLLTLPINPFQPPANLKTRTLQLNRIRHSLNNPSYLQNRPMNATNSTSAPLLLALFELLICAYGGQFSHLITNFGHAFPFFVFVSVPPLPVLLCSTSYPPSRYYYSSLRRKYHTNQASQAQIEYPAKILASTTPPTSSCVKSSMLLHHALCDFSATCPQGWGREHTSVLEAQYRQPNIRSFEKNTDLQPIHSLNQLFFHHIRSCAFLLGSPRWLLSLALRCVALTQP
jgi:hypothetical protein